MPNSEQKISRRFFLKEGAKLAFGTAAASVGVYDFLRNTNQIGQKSYSTDINQQLDNTDIPPERLKKKYVSKVADVYVAIEGANMALNAYLKAALRFLDINPPKS